MIFEEFILAIKEPRIVLMNIEEVELEEVELEAFEREESEIRAELEELGIEGLELEELVREEMESQEFYRDHPEHSYSHGWTFHVANPWQLHASNPAVVARGLLEVCSASRHVATRFLDQHPHTLSPPGFTAALTGLGLSFTSDIFWLLDDFSRLVNIYWDLPSMREGPFEEAEIHSVMVSLNAFDEALNWREKNEITGEYVNEPYQVGRHSLLREFFFRYPLLKDLIVMVDAPRDHVALDQIQFVGADDSTAYTMSDEDGPARCHAAFEKYVALQSECIKFATSEREFHEAQRRRMQEEMGSDLSHDDDDMFGDENDEPFCHPEYRWLQPWPELSFAFFKQ